MLIERHTMMTTLLNAQDRRSADIRTRPAALFGCNAASQQRNIRATVVTTSAVPKKPHADAADAAPKRTLPSYEIHRRSSRRLRQIRKLFSGKRAAGAKLGRSPCLSSATARSVEAFAAQDRGQTVRGAAGRHGRPAARRRPGSAETKRQSRAVAAGKFPRPSRHEANYRKHDCFAVGAPGEA